MKRRWRRAAGLILGLAWPAIFVGCGPADPMELRISAETPAALASWRKRSEIRAPGAHWVEFAEMMRELRLASPAARDSVEADDEVARRIHGLNVREVIVLGQQARLARLRKEGVELEEVARANGLLVTKPGDAESASYLAAFRGRQRERLKTLTTGIATAEERIRQLGGKVPPGERAGPLDAAPVALTRDQARREVMDLIRAHRDGLAVKYGAGSVEFDHDGLKVSGEQRTEFLARRREARDGAQAVVAVRLKGQWWIYEGRREAPDWPAAVRAALAPDDVALFEQAWFDLQAERWARQRAAEQPL